MNRRAAIALSEGERTAFLAERKTIILASLDREGYPHLVPMWFMVDDGCVYMTTYGRSQKVVNLRRNPKVALLVESGDAYDQLKGVLMRGTAEVIEDQELCVRVLSRIHEKHFAGLHGDVAEVMRAQARKRVVIKITPQRFASWDHRKLGGVY